MGGGAFILLKTGRRGPESAKQAEIGLASLFKILGIRPSGHLVLETGVWCHNPLM
jgi:hypothetical protein